MSTQDYYSGIPDLLYLCGCAARDETPDTARVRLMDLELLYQVSERHTLSSAVAMALERAGVKNESFTQARGKSFHRLAMLETEKCRLAARLQAEGIWYMPLKGAVLKDLYPVFGMRQMSDYDILFQADAAERVRSIMEDLGFTTMEFDWSFHDVYHKPPACVFEMHRRLFSSVHPVFNRYYENIEGRLIPDSEGSCGRHFSPEDFYLYMTAHEYVHYQNGGTGLRSLLDIYVFFQRYGSSLDLGYIGTEAEKLGLADFEHQSRSLALRLFEEGDIAPESEAMLNYILSSGTYGTVEHLTDNLLNKMADVPAKRLRYFLRRLFLPMSGVAERYPFFYQHKILLPCLFFYRIFLALTSRWPRIRKELSALLHYKTK